MITTNPASLFFVDPSLVENWSWFACMCDCAAVAMIALTSLCLAIHAIDIDIAIDSDLCFLIWCSRLYISLSLPLFWINLSFRVIFSIVNPPLMTYCMPDIKQSQCHHLPHQHHHHQHCHHQNHRHHCHHHNYEATVHRNRPAKGKSGAAWCVRLTP